MGNSYILCLQLDMAHFLFIIKVQCVGFGDVKGQFTNETFIIMFIIIRNYELLPWNEFRAGKPNTDSSLDRVISVFLHQPNVWEGVMRGAQLVTICNTTTTCH